MKLVVVKEVERFIFRTHVAPRAKYALSIGGIHFCIVLFIDLGDSTSIDIMAWYS